MRLFFDNLIKQKSHHIGISYHSCIEMCGTKYPPEFHINLWFFRFGIILGRRKEI